MPDEHLYINTKILALTLYILHNKPFIILPLRDNLIAYLLDKMNISIAGMLHGTYFLSKSLRIPQNAFDKVPNTSKTMIPLLSSCSCT